MFRLERPEYLYVLLLIPLFVWIMRLLYIQKKKRLSAFGNIHILRGFEKKLLAAPVKLQLLGCITLASLSIALCNPQIGTNKHVNETSGNDIFILFDVSKSMLADDIKPSRLEMAKNFTVKLVEKLRSNRIGLIVFAGRAYLQMPLTEDYGAAVSFIETAEPEMVPTQGTAIGSAIELAINQFDLQAQTNKSIIILSDGEDHDEGAGKAAKLAVKSGIRVFTVGVGTGKGGPMPVYNGGRADFKRDEDGNIIISKLDENALMKIAKAGNGNYYYIRSDETAINQLHKDMSSAGTKTSKSNIVYDYESYFIWFLLIALISLFFSWFRFSFHKLLPHSKKISMLVLGILMTHLVTGQELLNEARSADKLYKSGKYNEAEQKYDKLAKQNPKEIKYTYNKGNAEFKERKYKESSETYRSIIETSKDKRIKTKASYNKGNAMYEQKEYAEALKDYKDALKENPFDMDVKKNISMTLRQIKKEQQQKQNQEQKQQQDKKEKDQYKYKNDKEKNKQQGNKSQKQKEEDARKMLQIIENEEKNVMRKLPRESAEPPVNGKDW